MSINAVAKQQNNGQALQSATLSIGQIVVIIFDRLVNILDWLYGPHFACYQSLFVVTVIYWILVGGRLFWSC